MEEFIVLDENDFEYSSKTYVDYFLGNKEYNLTYYKVVCDNLGGKVDKIVCYVGDKNQVELNLIGYYNNGKFHLRDDEVFKNEFGESDWAIFIYDKYKKYILEIRKTKFNRINDLNH